MIYYNGTVITMEDDNYEEAVYIKNGKIESVGKSEDLLKAFPNAERTDLKGKILMPAFIDAHSHLSSFANSFLQVSLEETLSFDDIISKLKEYVKNNNIKKGEWIIANGYDHNLLKEKKHPPKKLLDNEFPDNPVVLQHKSGHFSVFNTLSLKEIGITEENSKGDKFIKFEEGYFEETASLSALKKVPQPDPQKLLDSYKKAQNEYASYGITTIQEGMFVSQIIPFYKALISSGNLKLDLVAYSDIKDSETIYKEFPESDGKYSSNFKLGGYKIFLDGSPQGRTAWMKTPYLGGEGKYFGNPTMTDEEVTFAIEKAAKTNRQILAHCNGDAASEQFINCTKKVNENYDVKKIRPVIIHAQLININQLDDVKRLGMIPSFFVAHVYYFGDIHIKNFGMERAKLISPAKSALDKGIKFTFHQDSPVIKPNMLETIWCAVNRITKNGIKLNENETISVKDAFKAVTLNAAYQYGEENTKGSVKKGKFANFVILDKNPFEVPKNDIKDISVLETICKGVTIYKREFV